MFDRLPRPKSPICRPLCWEDAKQWVIGILTAVALAALIASFMRGY